MAKFKALVCGDSFALLDKKHGHWLKIWAERHHGTTEHIGISGGNHVDIVHHLLQTVRWSDYDIVFYCITDFFRLYGSNQAALKNPRVQDIPYNDHSAIYALLRLNNSRDERHDHDWAQIMTVSEERDYTWIQNCTQYAVMPRMYGDDPSATALYDNISIRWLALANYTALQLLVTTLKTKRVPVVGIQHAWDQGTVHIRRQLPHMSNIWLVNTRDGQKHTEINYPTARSDNHMEVDDAIVVSKRFDAQVYKQGGFRIAALDKKNSNPLE